MSKDEENRDRGERVWRDWEANLMSRLESLGFNDIEEFLNCYPAEPYLKLAKRLGENVAALQLIWLQFKRAQERGKIREAAKDSLAREITAQLRRGWGKGARVEYRTASIYANWITELARCFPFTHSKADAVWKALKELQPLPSWLPTGACDPLINQAFARGWPEDDDP